jgi:hypothetical protein
MLSAMVPLERTARAPVRPDERRPRDEKSLRALTRFVTAGAPLETMAPTPSSSSRASRVCALPSFAHAAAPLTLAAFVAGCSGVFGDTSSAGDPPPITGIVSPPDPVADAGAGGVTEATDDDVGLRTPTPCAPDPLGRRQLRLLTREEYTNTIADVFALTLSTDAVPIEPRVDGYDTDANAAVVTPAHLDAYADLGKVVAARALAERRSVVVTCTTRDAACAKDVVRRLGRRLWRGAPSAADVDAIAALADASRTGGDFDVGVSLVLRALLASPRFLYRSELGEKVGAAYRLTGLELASFLSYSLWRTAPDEGLLVAAERGDLDSDAGLRREAERLLADPRAERGLLAFARGWLGTFGAAGSNKDLGVYPRFTAEVRNAMRDEEKAFVLEHFLGAKRTFRDLFTGDVVHVNDALAAYYGAPSPNAGGRFAPVRVPAGSDRGGLLTLGTVLATHAHSNESSPVKRGRFVRERLLCQKLTPPPPSIDTTPPGLDPTKTTRERFAAHTASPACSACHKYIDPVGFGFETFDGAGAERREEHGLRVDASGDLKSRESFDVRTSEPFDGPRALGFALAGSARAERCVAVQAHRFTRGYADDDTCDARRLADRYQRAGGDLRELLVQTLTARSVRERLDEGAQP